jgi:TonB family protein
MHAIYRGRVPPATGGLLLAALLNVGTPACLADVAASGSSDGSYIVVSPTHRSRGEVLKSLAEWQTSKLSDTADAAVASWSADNGLLTEQESGTGQSNRIKLNDLDLHSLRAELAGTWQIHASSISGHGAGFVGQLRAVDATSQVVALQALQDIYDLAAFAQQIAASKAACDFGDLGQYKMQAVHDNTNLWSDARHPPSGKTADAQVLYEVADLIHGPTAGGGQMISFAVQSFLNDPVQVEFEVELGSNTGSSAHYHLSQVVSNPAAPVILGLNAPLSREPFQAGQCITRVTFHDVVVQPYAAANTDVRHAPLAGAVMSPKAVAIPVMADSSPPIGKKVPSILPLPTTPSFDDACPYPDAARRRGETGVVWLLIHVSPEGSVLEAVVDESSGSESLDQATAACVKNSARFAVRRLGSKPISYWGRMKFTWGFGG